MSDFIQEMTTNMEPSNEKNLWQMYINGASGRQGSRAGIILIGPEKIKIEYTIRIAYGTTNNATEYEAFIMGLKLANKVRAENLQILCDSQLVVNQLKGTYETKYPNMIKYSNKAHSLIRRIEENGT